MITPRLHDGSKALNSNDFQSSSERPNWLPEQISWGTLLCSKTAVKFQKALKNTTRLARTGHFFPAEEMAALWVNSPELLGWVKI